MERFWVRVNFGSTLAGVFLLLGPHVWAQEELKKIESVLDKLESKLIENEKKSHQFEPSEISVMPEVQLQKDTFSVSPTSTQRLSEIKKNLNELEEELEAIQRDFSQINQKIKEHAKNTEAMTLNLNIANREQNYLKSVHVRIDGIDVYKISDEAGLWTATDQIPLYDGPMLPGQHRIDLSALLRAKESAGIPLPTAQSHYLTQSFNVEVKAGQTKNVFGITIVNKSSDAERVVAILDSEEAKK